MITFEIEDLYTRASGDEHEIHILRGILSCYVPGYKFTKAYKQGRWNGKKYFLTGRGVFPTGLLPYALKKVPGWIQMRKVDKRKIPQVVLRDPHLEGITLRPYQRAAIFTSCSKRRGVIEAPAGSGKTEIAIGIISCLLYPKTLYLVHQKDLMYQTARRIENRLKYEPGIVGDGNYNEKKITVATVQTLWSRLKEPVVNLFLRNIELLIIDECHHASATTWYRIAMKTHAPFRFGLSATPLVASSLRDMKLAAATGPVIVKIREGKLAEYGYLSSPKIIMVTVNTPFLPPQMPYQMAYEQGIVRNAARNLLIEQIAKRLTSEGRTVLVLVETIEHGQRLSELLDARFLSGRETKEVREETVLSFSRGEIDLLIATKILDEGIDAPAVSGVIMAAGGKSYVRCIQRIGRSMRVAEDKKDPLVFDFVDGCHPYLERHSLKRMEFYRKKNYRVSVLSEKDLIRVPL